MPVYSKQPAVLDTMSPDCINDHFLWFGLNWVTEGFETTYKTFSASYEQNYLQLSWLQLSWYLKY